MKSIKSSLNDHPFTNEAEQKVILLGMLFSRLILFAVFQTFIAFIFHSWSESEKYWMLVATLVNIIGIGLLMRLFKAEGKSYFDLFRFDKMNWKNDLSLFLGLVLLLVPLALAPNYFLSKWFWSNPLVPFNTLFQPMSGIVPYILLVVFPMSIALAELTTYFGYIMPRLERVLQNKRYAILLPVVFLSLQHCCLPLVFDAKFIIYRGLMYLPFALFVGIALSKRPRLLPYFVILHGLMDMQAVIMLIVESNH